MPRKELDDETKQRGERLSKFIRNARKKKNMTQEKLAQESGVKEDTIR